MATCAELLCRYTPPAFRSVSLRLLASNGAAGWQDQCASFDVLHELVSAGFFFACVCVQMSVHMLVHVRKCR